MSAQPASPVLDSNSESAQFDERSACIQCRGIHLEDVCSGSFDAGPVGDFIASDPWGEHPAPFLVGHRWVYVKCTDCGQAFHRFILTPEWNERRFSKWMTHEAIAEFESRVNTPERALRKGTEHVMHAIRLEKLTRTVRSNNRLRILDFGCGAAEFLATCARFGFEVTGIDRSTARRDHATVTVLPEIDDAQGRQFHALTLFEVLEHLDDPRSILERLTEFLVPGGILILETPNCEGVNHIESRDEYLKIAPMEHINGFTPTTLQKFAEHLGYRRINSPVCWVTSDYSRVIKSIAKTVLRPVIKDSTRQYFRKYI